MLSIKRILSEFKNTVKNEWMSDFIMTTKGKPNSMQLSKFN